MFRKLIYVFLCTLFVLFVVTVFQIIFPDETFYKHQFKRFTSLEFPDGGNIVDQSYLPGPRGQDFICAIFKADEKEIKYIANSLKQLTHNIPETRSCTSENTLRFKFEHKIKIEKPHEKQSGYLAIDFTNNVVLFSFKDG